MLFKYVKGKTLEWGAHLDVAGRCWLGRVKEIKLEDVDIKKI